jgi:hypothetical protein
MLKNWADRQRPPENGRARLLWEAAHISRNEIEMRVTILRPQLTTQFSSSSPEWSQRLFTWINENSIQFGIPARII